MDSSTEDTVISEELWRTWFHQRKRREEAAARKLRAVAGIVMGLVAICVGVYFLVAK